LIYIAYHQIDVLHDSVLYRKEKGRGAKFQKRAL
jgi:hypothetical protein